MLEKRRDTESDVAKEYIPHEDTDTQQEDGQAMMETEMGNASTSPDVSGTAGNTRSQGQAWDAFFFTALRWNHLADTLILDFAPP